MAVTAVPRMPRVGLGRFRRNYKERLYDRPDAALAHKLCLEALRYMYCFTASDPNWQRRRSPKTSKSPRSSNLGRQERSAATPWPP